jgi:tetratricopeptide (TPR) repeat protein
MEHELTMASTAGPSSRTSKIYVKALICLVAGLAIGHLSRGLLSPAPVALPTASALRPSAPGATGGEPMPSFRQSPASPTHGAVNVRHPSISGSTMGAGHTFSLVEMKRMADQQAAPLLEKLKSDPKNTALLTQVGAIYHTTHQFAAAATYYDKAVQTDPRNVNLRTKLAASLYRNGEVDGAIAQLQKGLSYNPKDPNSLFNLGMIKLHGKQDGKGAVAAWQQLLKSNPQLGLDRKVTVQKLMADVLTTLGGQREIEGARGNDGHK